MPRRLWLLVQTRRFKRHDAGDYVVGYDPASVDARQLRRILRACDWSFFELRLLIGIKPMQKLIVLIFKDEKEIAHVYGRTVGGLALMVSTLSSFRWENTLTKR